MPKHLTQDQVDAYHRDGFVGPIDLLEIEEAAQLRAKIEEVEAKMGSQIQKRCKIKAHLPFTFLCDVISHPKLLDAVEDIIGPNILCWGSSFFQKEAHDPGFVSWHQDSTYYGLEPPDTLTAWLAISESNLESGCMEFIPGTHNRGLIHHEEYKSDENLLSRGQTIDGVDETKALPMILKAGQFSFHKEDCVHGSAPNKSDDRRIGLSIHYVPPSIRETGFPGASAMVLRGEDTEGHWAVDMTPKQDWDPECLAELDRVATMYTTVAPKDRVSAT
ncbi:MAG: phytanoyl-CoA dioxygenase [Rhodospirillaceae bacterium]|nr:phytanoyl-CoA dioxygenase [Rhodospirillaceae bacterium]|tara:strand:+ start:3482 stop:4306 length:825 start_codon:yes stop_codon:yes gene_type:complete